ncbi:MAG: hypothetical protein FD135_4722, partial [Comamonadaceae bacterium]
MYTLTRAATGLRLFVICLVAASVSLPMVWISLGKLLLFLGCLVFFALSFWRKSPDQEPPTLWSVRMI